jgi:hypothetical protein
MKGRPFLGVISGFFFGLFGAVTLFLFGVIPLDSHLVWILPILGIVLGLLMATWAPFGSSTVDKPAPAAAPASTATPEPPTAAPENTDDTIVDEDPPVEPQADGSASAGEPPVH